MESIHIEGTKEDLKAMQRVIELCLLKLEGEGEGDTLLSYYLMQIHEHLKEQIQRPLPY
jgi:hypothetical protein